MSHEIYDELARALNARSTMLLSIPCDEFYAFAEALFTPEQAQLACSMPMEPVSAQDLAKKTGEDAKKVERTLEEMTDRGLIKSCEEDGKKTYQFLPLVPGLIELQFMKGEVSEHSKRLTVLLRTYMKAAKEIAMKSPPPAAISASTVIRTIPVNRPMRHLPTIMPYAEVVKLVDDAECWAVGTCVCRHHGDLLDKPCAKPKQNMCMIVGESARDAAGRGLARLVSKDEARKYIGEADEAGLVHSFANTNDEYINLLCNCCLCHCMILRGVKRSPLPSQAVYADWVVMVDADECTGCGACIDRCWMEALKMDGTTAVRDANRCIGCGVCMYICPTDAMKMEKRETVKV